MLVDPEAIVAGDLHFEGAPDAPNAQVEHRIAAELRRSGYEVRGFPFSAGRVKSLMIMIEQERPRVAFNLVEHLWADRLLSPDVPALLELLDMPYTGCSSIGMSLALDKGASKQLILDEGLTAPRFIVVPNGAPVPRTSLRFPIIVKPRFGGGSEGVSLSSLVRDRVQLDARVKYIHRRYRQAAICEEFIAGREFSVGVLGYGASAFALPVRETVFGSAVDGGPSFATQTVKGSRTYRERWSIRYAKADIDTALEEAIRAFCLRAYAALELCGYARIDLRVSAEHVPFFLEANPNPDLSPHVFGVMASWIGMTYKALLKTIIESALESHLAER